MGTWAGGLALLEVRGSVVMITGGRWALQLPQLLAVPWWWWSGTCECWGLAVLGWPAQPDVPLLIITGIALRAKLHLGHLCKLGVSAPLLQDRLCNHIRNQIHNLDFTFFWTSGCSRFGPADFIGILVRKKFSVHARMENKCWKAAQTVTLELIFKF